MVFNSHSYFWIEGSPFLKSCKWKPKLDRSPVIFIVTKQNHLCIEKLKFVCIWIRNVIEVRLIWCLKTLIILFFYNFRCIDCSHYKLPRFVFLTFGLYELHPGVAWSLFGTSLCVIGPSLSRCSFVGEHCVKTEHWHLINFIHTTCLFLTTLCSVCTLWSLYECSACKWVAALQKHTGCGFILSALLCWLMWLLSIHSFTHFTQHQQTFLPLQKHVDLLQAVSFLKGSKFKTIH